MTTATYCDQHKCYKADVGCYKCLLEASPLLKRYFVCEVAIKQFDLTDGDQCTVEEGWKSLEEEISRAVRQPQIGRDGTPFQITFDEWEAQP